jgi:hypothetical protein
VLPAVNDPDATSTVWPGAGRFFGGRFVGGAAGFSESAERTAAEEGRIVWASSFPEAASGLALLHDTAASAMPDNKPAKGIHVVLELRLRFTRWPCNDLLA